MCVYLVSTGNINGASWLHVAGMGVAGIIEGVVVLSALYNKPGDVNTWKKENRNNFSKKGEILKRLNDQIKKNYCIQYLCVKSQEIICFQLKLKCHLFSIILFEHNREAMCTGGHNMTKKRYFLKYM